MANPEDAARPLNKKDPFVSGSVKQLHHGSRTSLHRSNEYIASVVDIPAAVTAEKKKESAVEAFTNILYAMTDFSILKNKRMLLICIGNVFSMLGYYLPIMCLVSFAVEDNGVDRTRASFLLTIFGTEFSSILKKDRIDSIGFFQELAIHSVDFSEDRSL